MLKHAMSAALESKIAGAFVNAKLAMPERIFLLKMVHPQPVTPLEIDITTACGALTKQLMPKHPKAIDLIFFWLRDHANQNQFHLCWNKGDTNKADYFTKNHQASCHQKVRSVYLAS